MLGQIALWVGFLAGVITIASLLFGIPVDKLLPHTRASSRREEKKSETPAISRNPSDSSVPRRDVGLWFFRLTMFLCGGAPGFVFAIVLLDVDRSIDLHILVRFLLAIPAAIMWFIMSFAIISLVMLLIRLPLGIPYVESESELEALCILGVAFLISLIISASWFHNNPDALSSSSWHQERPGSNMSAFGDLTEGIFSVGSLALVGEVATQRKDDGEWRGREASRKQVSPML